MENLFKNKFEQKLAQITLKLQKLLFYRIIQRTVLMIFPFVLFGSFIKIIQITILRKDSFLTDIIPKLNNDFVFNHINDIATALYSLTLGWVAVIATFGAAKYTAKHFHRDDQMAGLTSISSLLIITFTYSRVQPLSFHGTVLGMRGLLFAILLGMLVGWTFKATSSSAPNHRSKHLSSNVLERTFISLKPISIVLIVSVIFSFLVNITYYSDLPNNIVYSLATNYQSNNALIQLLSTIGFSLYTIIASFFGWSGIYSPIEIEKSDPTVLNNLNYALNHHTAWGAPNLFTSNTLYHSFATLGGTGSVLALIIAIFLVSKDPDFQTVARWTMIPSVFNLGSSIMSGIPVLFNVIFIIPFILAPLTCMLMAAIALQLHLMPPSVYPIPTGAPGLLSAFIGTNGSWQALIFSLISLTVSVYIYIPFVRIAEKLKTIDNLALDEGGISDDENLQ
ncbi:PTS transporter subunit EIIC [Companilactobacillus nodensis]|uniref:Permease IIC component n=1 Tax=Companilactobacillus nodensis DSM 19682 = JCM 14932 = NBRC 107160 TaxID=1423775 RepID=A0A0R1KGW3_9LACO|nr:PTS transporter subunit EIIC [Companilactobacillus nodensis]KRK79178.1 cellobiose PTS, EIIC [Companilactobacillus nodensis DSM 19682 = JCM 14932 = NBRC 107160]